jgi:hypothetical protein
LDFIVSGGRVVQLQRQSVSLLLQLVRDGGRGPGSERESESRVQ